MFRMLIAAATVTALVLVGAAAAAGPVVLASPGPTPFATCTADHAAAQIAAGSTLYPNSEIEPRSARFGSTIVGEYQQDRWSDGGARGLVTSVSHDNGASWNRVVVPGITKCSHGNYDRASDPWVSFAPNGDLYAISLSFDAFDTHNAIIVSKSTYPSLGDTWGPPIEVTADNTNGLDKESITADPFQQGYVYATWDRLLAPGGSTHASDQGAIHSHSYKSQTFVSRSTDFGATWSAPKQIFIDSSFSGSIGGMIRVLPGGALIDGLATYGNAAWKGGKCASVSVLRSPDRGVTWSDKPIIVAPFSCTYGGAHDPDTGDPVRSGGLPDFAVDGLNVYAVWEDALPDQPTIGRIKFSQSTDGGLTWSPPTVISKTTGAIDAFIPTVAVNSNHTVGVTYYDFRNNVAGSAANTTTFWLTTCAASCATPASWFETPAAGPFDLRQAPNAGGEFIGDYMGMTTNGSVFEPFFIQAVSAPLNPTDAFFTTGP